MEKEIKKTTDKKGSAKKDLPSLIRESYINHLLEEGHVPVSIYKFTKSIKIKENDFYDHYNSFDGIEEDIWKFFARDTIARLHNDQIFMEYSAREKLLAFYFTFIEVLKERRSYVLFKLHNMPRSSKTPSLFHGLKTEFLTFANDIVQEGKETEEVADRPYLTNKYKDGLWWQLMFVVNFWVKDTSKGFEKTDAAIEKAVHLSFDLMGKGPVDSMVDFAKFIFQNRK